jgi:hypothetical protein
MSILCEAVDADIHAVAKGMGLDSRINPKFLHSGPGYGGSCFPKDAQALVRMAQDHKASSRIVEAVIEVNENSIQECISVTPYWDDSEMDAALYARITATLMAEFVTVATCIDAKMLRDKIVRVLQNELGGLPFRSGQGAWFIPKYNDDDSYLETLENYSRLLESFGSVNTLTRTPGEANWLGEDGKPHVSEGPILKSGEDLSIFFFNEINRARPQVHSLLLRIMAEKTLSAFNKEFYFPHLIVFADRNQVEREETFEIPSAARDKIGRAHV